MTSALAKAVRRRCRAPSSPEFWRQHDGYSYRIVDGVTVPSLVVLEFA
jgi:hypothetical protein